MACGKQPTCGSQGAGTGPTLGTVGSDILFLLGLVGTIASIVKLLTETKVITILGISASSAVWIAAVAAALVTWAVVFDFFRLRCLANPDTLKACSAGVVQTIVPAFNSATDEIFPFTAMHDRVDVVVRCIYWPLVQNLAGWIWCNTDPDISPMLRGYYKNSQVCGAGLGATIGAGVGAIGGIFLGALAGGAIASAACGPLAWLCLIIAVIVAAIIAAVCVLVGALAGGQIGKAVSGGGPPTTTDGNLISVSDYVTTMGGVLTSGDDNGARIYWFVNSTMQHGQSGAMSPFDHTDPDAMLMPDGCPK